MFRSLSVVSLACALAACGGGGDSVGNPTTAPGTGRIALSTGTTSTTIARGNTARLDLALTRTGFSGTVALSTEPLPSGVTVTFEPATIAQGGTAAAVTVAAGPEASPGSVSVVVLASGAGVTAARLPLSVTISASAPPPSTPGFTLVSASPAALSAQPGQTVTSTIAIGRTDGFDQGVVLSTTGVPAGVQATFAPNVTTAASSTLTLVVSSGAPTGTFPITVTGTGGAISASLSLSLSITAVTGGGTGTATWSFCDPEESPVWFVAQAIPGGAWTPVAPSVANGRTSYSVTVGTLSGVAFAVPHAEGGVHLTVMQGSRAELNRYGAAQCALYRQRQTLTGTVSGLTSGTTFLQYAAVFAGGSGTAVGTNEAFEVEAVAGATDLLAQRFSADLGLTTSFIDRVILRRNVTYTGQIPPLDFGSAEAFAPATAQLSVGNGGEDSASVLTLLHTERGFVGGFFAQSVLSGSTHPIFGLPASRVQPGDLHEIRVRAVPKGLFGGERTVTTYNRQVADRHVVLGAALSVPTVTTQPSPYPRYTATGVWQADYADLVSFSLYDRVPGQNTWTIVATRPLFGAGAGSWTLTTPDFTGVSGFNPAWALGAQATWEYFARGETGAGPMGPIDGTVARFARAGR